MFELSLDRLLEEEERGILLSEELGRKDGEDGDDREEGVPEACTGARALMSFLCRERRVTHSSHRRFSCLVVKSPQVTPKSGRGLVPGGEE